MIEMPSDGAIRELIARLLMEFGGEWTHWFTWRKQHGEFFQWYCNWCLDNGAPGGVESVPKMRRYIDVELDKCKLRVSEAGKEFLI